MNLEKWNEREKDASAHFSIIDIRFYDEELHFKDTLLAKGHIKIFKKRLIDTTKLAIVSPSTSNLIGEYIRSLNFRNLLANLLSV